MSYSFSIVRLSHQGFIKNLQTRVPCGLDFARAVPDAVSGEWIGDDPEIPCGKPNCGWGPKRGMGKEVAK